MKKYICLIAVALLALSCVKPGPTPTPDPTPSGKNADAMGRSAKRGVAFSFTRTDDLKLLCPYISWDYNWGNTANEEASMWFETYNIEYCPMCWSGRYSADRIREYAIANPSTKYLLAFNEPNLTDQANMTPSEAAELWPDVVALAKELNLKLVAPAMNYGTLAGYSDPIKWLDEFFSKPGVSVNDIDAFSLHCYMKSPDAVKGFIERFYKYDKPIWLTEFCAWDGGVSNVEQQMTYMSKMLNYLEQEPRVERYAWFIPRYKTPNTEPYMQLLTNAPDIHLTDLGKMYTLFSTFDQSVYLNTKRPIYAGEYCKTDNTNVQVRPCPDSRIGEEGLMITSMASTSPIVYQLNVEKDATAIELRYTSYSNSILSVKVDGTEELAELPRTGSLNTWESCEVAIPITAGQHKVSIELLDGSLYFSGMIIK